MTTIASRKFRTKYAIKISIHVAKGHGHRIALGTLHVFVTQDFSHLAKAAQFHCLAQSQPQSIRACISIAKLDFRNSKRAQLRG